MVYTLQQPDSGLSRMFLWWAWNMGSNNLKKMWSSTSPPKQEHGVLTCSAVVRTMFKNLQTCIKNVRITATEAIMPGNKDRKSVPMSLVAHATVPVLDGVSCTMIEELILKREAMLVPLWTQYRGMCARFWRAFLVQHKEDVQVD